jgi:hypothetical protein
MLKYLGRGFLPGIPARDLTTAEVKIHGKDRLLASGIYAEPVIKIRKEVDHDKRNQGITPDTDQ